MERLCPQDFDEVYRLMEVSFPAAERRTREGQQALLEEADYRLWGERDSHGLLAFAAVWELSPMTFVEHLAVDPVRRGGGHAVPDAGHRKAIQAAFRRTGHRPGLLCAVHDRRLCDPFLWRQHR